MVRVPGSRRGLFSPLISPSVVVATDCGYCPLALPFGIFVDILPRPVGLVNCPLVAICALVFQGFFVSLRFDCMRLVALLATLAAVSFLCLLVRFVSVFSWLLA